jgi:O-acetylserine/cysteine efflux transporter
MSFSNFLLALLIVVVWGLNFIFIKFGLNEISPLWLCATRFILASLPAIFFIKPPKPFRVAIWYGLVTFAIQFALLFLGIYAGISPGLASLILQVQVFFSIFFAAIWLGEKPHSWQILGAICSFIGLFVAGMYVNKEMPFTGFVLIVTASAFWGIGNYISKKASHNINMLSLVIWGSFIASIPLLLLSLVFEGSNQIITSYHQLTWLGLISVFYITYASTWFGYGVWNWLLKRYPVAVISPFTLLVPIVGLASSAIILKEPFQTWKLFASLLVIGGLCINLLGARLFVTKRQKIKDY